MSKRVCPWWLGYLLTCPIRRWRQDPRQILAPYVREGMTVLEPGPGMGFFTLELLRLAGHSGRVVAVDVQSQMLERLRRRARKAGLAGRLDAHLAPPGTMNLGDLRNEVDFTLAFAVVHEFPSASTFFREVAAVSKPGARVLFAEPSGHVTTEEFESEIKAGLSAGFQVADRLAIRGNNAVLLKID